MELWMPAMTVVGVYALAVISPGPNFLVISRSALAYSRRTGLRTALGVASGSILWIAFGFFGVAAVLAQLPILFTLVKVLGASYLAFAAFKIFWTQLAKRHSNKQSQPEDSMAPSDDRAFRHGLLTQMSNPKAALFVLALFSSAVSPATPPALKLVMAVTMITFSFSWYLLVAAIFSRPGFQTVYGRIQRPANVIFAGLLLYLGVNILLSS